MEDHRRDGQTALIAPRGFHHLAIQVRHLARAEHFYCDTLGLPVLRRWPAAEGRGERSIWVDTGDGSFLALEVTAAPPGDDDATGTEGPSGGGPGLHLVALRIAPDERNRWQQRLEQAGVAVYHQTAFTLYVRDPEGNRIGLSHYPASPGGDGDGDDGGGDGGEAKA
jgi:glyoxylase I family protein